MLLKQLVNISEAKKEDKKFYLQHKGGDNHSGPYKSEEEAEEALDKLLARAKKSKHDDEEVDALKSLKIVKESKLSEAAEYEDSSHFESDVSDIEQYFKKIQKIIKSAEWKDWMKETDSNFGEDVNAVQQSAELLRAISTAQQKFDQLYNDIVKASE